MKILFVCAGNAFRSPVAEALLKKLRKDITVDSAGINPASRIGGASWRFLSKENASGNIKDKPEGVTTKNLDDYDLIIVMEDWQRQAILELNPRVRDKIQVWNIPDPYFLPPDEAGKVFERIKLMVEELAKSL